MLSELEQVMSLMREAMQRERLGPSPSPSAHGH
jgi:hypothetical protein